MRSRWPIRLQRILPAVMVAASCEAAHAAPLEGVIGLDVQAGPRNETTRTAFAGAGLGLSPRVAASLLLARSETSGIAASHAAVGGIALAISPQARLRGWAVRSLSAPEGAAFTRWIVGPELGHADGVRLGLFYSDETNEAARPARGARAELHAPLPGPWTARVQASRVTSPDAEPAEQATVGLAWAPVARLEILADVGVGRGRNTAGFVPTGGPSSPLEPLFGPADVPAPSPGGTASRVAIVGVRVSLP